MNEDSINYLITEGMSTKTLNFRCLDLNIDDAALMLSDAIVSRRLFGFEHMIFESTNISSKGLAALVDAAIECRALETFNVKGNALTNNCGNMLGKLLQNRGCLKTLDVSKNKLGDIGISALANAFNASLVNVAPTLTLSLSTLRVLDLSENDLGDMAVLSLCRCVTQYVNGLSNRSSPLSLCCLSLNGNKLGDKAAQCLAQLLHPLSGADESFKSILELNELHINNNPGIGPVGLNSLINTLSHKQCPMRRLGLSETSPDISVLENLSSVLSVDSCKFELIDLSFSEHTAKNIISISSLEGSDCRLGNCLRSLSRSLRGRYSNKIQRGEKAPVINLGKLPEVLCLACIAAGDVDDVKQFYEMAISLCALGDARNEFQLTDQVSDWIKENSGNLSSVVSSPFASPLQNGKNNTPLNDPTVAIAPTPNNDVQTTVSSISLPSTPYDSSPMGREELDTLPSDSYAQSNFIKKEKRFTPTSSASSSQDETNMASLSSKEGVQRNQISTPSTLFSPPLLSQHQKANSRIRPSAVIEQQQEEFERLRQEHSYAFHELADEIQKLIKVPTTSNSKSLSASLRDNDVSSFEPYQPPLLGRYPSASHEDVPKYKDRIDVSDMRLLDSVVKELALDVKNTNSVQNKALATPPISRVDVESPRSQNSDSIRHFVKESVEVAIGAAQTQWMETMAAIIRNREPNSGSSDKSLQSSTASDNELQKASAPDSNSSSNNLSPPTTVTPSTNAPSVPLSVTILAPSPLPSLNANPTPIPTVDPALSEKPLYLGVSHSLPPVPSSTNTKKDSFTDAYIMLLQERILSLEAQAVATSTTVSQLQSHYDHTFAQLEARLTSLERLVFVQQQQRVSALQIHHLNNRGPTFTPLNINASSLDPFDLTIASGKPMQNHVLDFSPVPPSSTIMNTSTTNAPPTLQSKEASIVPPVPPTPADKVPLSESPPPATTDSVTVEELQARLTMLEDVLESEHMTTLQVLDSMLAAQQERMQPQNTFNASDTLKQNEQHHNAIDAETKNGLKSVSIGKASSSARSSSQSKNRPSTRVSMGVLTPSSLKSTSSSLKRG